MFGLAAGENLGQRRPYNGVNSLFRVNKHTLRQLEIFLNFYKTHVPVYKQNKLVCVYCSACRDITCILLQPLQKDNQIFVT